MKKDERKWFVIYGEIGGDQQYECFDTEDEATQRAWIILTDYTPNERIRHEVNVCEDWAFWDDAWHSTFDDADYVPFYYMIKDGGYTYPDVLRTLDDAIDFVNVLMEEESELYCYKIVDNYGETVWKHDKEVQ